jgi:ATP-dependent protease Clp ATPase subunit
MKTIVAFVLHRYRAKSWNVDNGVANKEYPGRFYMAEDVESLLDRLTAAHDFDVRRYQALEAFYLSEIDKLRADVVEAKP